MYVYLTGGVSSDSATLPVDQGVEPSQSSFFGKHHKGLSIKFNSRGGSRQVLRQLLRRSSYPYPEEDLRAAEGFCLL